MQPVAVARTRPAPRTTHSVRFIVSPIVHWFLSLTNITVSRAGSETLMVTVLVKLAIGPPLASRNSTVTLCAPAGRRVEAKLRYCGRLSHARVSAAGVVAAEKILLTTPAARR